MIQVSAKHKIVAVPVQDMLVNLFPAAPRITYRGKPMIAIHHGIDETRLLRNMGMDIPSPILSQYDWEGGTPFEVQKRTAELLTTETRAYVLNGMGTGKTKAALWAWRFLYRAGLAKKLLVVAPLSTLNFTWGAEIFATLPGMKYQILYGTKAKRLSRLADPEADIYVINHDGLTTIGEEVMANFNVDTIVLDELAVYRNGTAARTKMAARVVLRMKWAWGMTGSPTPNEPTDAWGQCKVLTPHTVPKYFGRFRDSVMSKMSAFRYIPKADATEKVYAVMQPAVRFTLDDVVELPDVIERPIDIAMGPRQARIYKQMEEHAHAAIEANEITAMNAGAVLSKLLQISTGYVYTRDRTVVSLDNDLRLEALVDAVMSSDRKVIVFVPFKHALEGIVTRLGKEGLSCATVSGDTPRAQRDRIFNLFQNTSSLKVLAAHPQCMSHGLTLTAADTIIWFAPTTSLEIFEQANARIRRIGQKHKQQILMFQSTKAERKMYVRLRQKQKIQNMLLDMFADGTD